MAKDGFIIGDRLAVKIQRKRIVKIPKEEKQEEIENGDSNNIPNDKHQMDKRK